MKNRPELLLQKSLSDLFNFWFRNTRNQTVSMQNSARCSCSPSSCFFLYKRMWQNFYHSKHLLWKYILSACCIKSILGVHEIPCLCSIPFWNVHTRGSYGKTNPQPAARLQPLRSPEPRALPDPDLSPGKKWCL